MMKPNDDVFDSIVSEADFPRLFWIWKIEEDKLYVTKVTTAVRWICVCKVLQLWIRILGLAKLDIAQGADCLIDC